MEIGDAKDGEFSMEWYFSKKNVFYENVVYFRNVGLLLKNPILIILRTLFQNFLIVGCFLHFITAEKSKGYATDFLDDCAIVIAGSGMNFNIAAIMAQLDSILELIRKLNVHKIFGEPLDYHKGLKILRRFLFAYFVFVVIGVNYYCYLGIRYKSKCIKEQIHAEKEKVCGIVSQTYYVKGIEDAPYNQIVFVLQAISAIMTTHSTGAIYTFVFIACEHIVMRINHLKYNLEKIYDIKDQTEKKIHLRNCILYHNDIISLVDHINKCFSSILFAAISVDTLIVGILTVQLMLMASLPVIMHLIAWVGTLFLLSLTGQRVHDSGVSLQDCIYSLFWYEESISVQKDLNFVMFRCQKPLMLKCGDFGVMYFPTYLNVIKTSYSYVAVLLKTM